MNWTATNFTWPASASAIHADVDAMLANAGGELTSANTRLGAVPGVSFNKNPVAIAAVSANATWQQLLDLIDNGGQYLVVHPWQQGIGEGKGVYRHLSAPNAAEQLASKFTDLNDAMRPSGNQDALGLLISAANLDEFTSRLAAFSAVFPLPELQMVQRRCEQLSTFERDKTELPNAANNARWQDRDHVKLGACRSSLSALGDQVALATAYASENETPVTELQNLITKKGTALTAREANYQSVVAGFTGGAGHVLFMGNSNAAQMAASLRSASGPGYENVFSVAVLFVSPVGGLTFIKEVMGL